MSLATLLDPASVAVIGASQNPDKIGGRPIRFMKEMGYAGRIYPINPGRDTIQNLPSYPDLAALPETPEAAIIALGRDGVLAAVEDCAARGVRACVIMSSGFGETGPEGRADEARILATAAAAGMRIVGPNSQGIANFGTGAILNFSTMFIEEPPVAGPVACISQSGAMSVVPYGLLRARGIGIRHCHATGNDVDVTVSELAAEVVLDPQVKLCLIYLETLRDPWNLALAAERARERGVPIIALKSGRSPDGQRAAASHTGAMATEDRVLDAFLTRHGIWRAEGTEDLVHAVELYLQGWRPTGRRLAIISNSGATCVLAADAAARHGLNLARFAPETEAAVRDQLPAFAASSNPVDLTAALLSDSGLFGKVLPHVGQDPDVDMLLIGLPVSGKAYDFPTFARDTARFAQAQRIPVVVAAPQRDVRAAFSAEGIPCFETEDGAIRALSQFTRHLGAMVQAPGGPAGPFAQPAGRRLLAENAALDRLALAGLPVPQRRLCATADEAAAFLAQRSRGIVLKASSAHIPHKSEHGLVRVGLTDPAEVVRHFAEIAARVQDMGIAFEGVLAAEMVPAGQEMVVGGHLDPVFGPVIVIGAGGIAVEAMPDNCLLLAPVTGDAVDAALEGLRIGPLFRGIRGGAPLDRCVIHHAVQVVSDLLTTGAATSVDINPLIVTSQGGSIADALIELSEAPPGSEQRT